ncbi:MAG: glycogen synthase GlgA [Kofleriaceae bacterium]|nr:glycogen synthase GlgA [Kofleriaceae bacterium]
MSFRVLHVVSELAPWSQTGGLADVTAALPAAQVATGAGHVATLSPLYRETARALADAAVALTPVDTFSFALPHTILPCQLLRSDGPRGVANYWLACDELFDRAGFYGPTHVTAYNDNHIRFAALGVAALRLPVVLGGAIDVLHGHDWQAGFALMMAKLHAGDSIRTTVLTIHNLAFRGLCTRAQYDELGLPASAFNFRQCEFWGHASMLKAGIAFADAVTTVSPSYADEILTPQFGEGLDEFLRFDAPRIVGIVNGIDEQAWDPSTGAGIAAAFSSQDLSGKALCRQRCIEPFATAVQPEELVLGIVARMTEQKGFDIVADIVPQLASLGARLVVVGAGELAIERRFRYLRDVFSHHVAVTIGFSPQAARDVYAGCDMFMMPSRFEPCGLGQLYAMRYGTVPIVHAVGGLRDTVMPVSADGTRGTGYVMTVASSSQLLDAITAARVRFSDKKSWTALMQRGMRRDSSWRQPATDYVTLYRALLRR